MIQMDSTLFDYFDAFKHNCLKACVYNYLKLQNVQEPLLYIDSALRLYQTQSDKLFSVYNNPSNDFLFPQFRHKIDHMWGEHEEVWKKNSLYLDQGIPIIADVDVFYLPYRMEYTKRHGSHCIILLQYNNQSVEIVDWSDPVFFRGWVDKEYLCRSRKSENPYDNNPFSGNSIVCYSIAIEPCMPYTTEEKAIKSWILNTKLSCDVFDSIITLIEVNQHPVFIKEICDKLYFIIPQIQFSLLFHLRFNKSKNKVLCTYLHKALSSMKILNSLLIKLYLRYDIRNRDVILTLLEECKAIFEFIKQIINDMDGG